MNDQLDERAFCAQRPVFDTTAIPTKQLQGSDVMYETFFGLNRRPFLATPDASCFAPTDLNQEALDALVVCAESGQGIGILTAGAGLGKTALCQRLLQELSESFRTVFLGNCNFSSPQSLLQAVLYELGQPYSRMPEEELRLELRTAVRSARPDKQGVVIVCDEAHLLSESLLEEIRTLVDFAEEGHALVRVVLSGQLDLEETLVSPSLDALNQRVRCHVSLSPLTQLESATYVAHRLRWAGGNIEQLFTPEAVRLIAHSGDGSPRCLNQLADHSLLLAFVTESFPVTDAIVREALNDMRQLPLQMNEPSFEQSIESDQVIVGELDQEESSSFEEEIAEPTETEIVAESSSSNADSHQDFVEHGSESSQTFGAGIETEEYVPSDQVVAFEVGADVGGTVDETPDVAESSASEETAESFIESDVAPEVPSEGFADAESQFETDHALSSEVEVVDVGQPASFQGTQDSVEEMDATLSFDLLESTTMFVEQNDIGLSESESESNSGTEFEEEAVFDRYAAIDDGQTVPHFGGIVMELTQRDDVAISGESSLNDAERQQVIEELRQGAESHFTESATTHDVDCDRVIESTGVESEEDQITSAEFNDENQFVESNQVEESAEYEPVAPEYDVAAEGFEFESEEFTREVTPDVVIDSMLPVIESSANDWIYPDDRVAELEAVTSADQFEGDGFNDQESEALNASQVVSDMSVEREEIEQQIGADVLDLCLETQQSIIDRMNEIAAQDAEDDSDFVQEYDVIQPEVDERPIHNDVTSSGEKGQTELRPTSESIRQEMSETPNATNRPYRYLFSELRRRQQR